MELKLFGNRKESSEIEEDAWACDWIQDCSIGFSNMTRDMRHQSTLYAMIGVLLALSILHVSAQTWYRCDELPGEEALSTDTSTLFVRNMTYTISPHDADGVPMEENYVGLGWRGLQEWRTDPNGTCSEPDFPYPPGVRFGDRVAHTRLTIAEMECRREFVEDELPNGVKIESVITYARNTSYPDFLVTLNATRSYGEYTINYGNTVTTNGTDYVVQYRPSSIKISMKIDNFPYSAPTIDSHVVVYVTGFAKMEYSDFNLSFGQNTEIFRFHVVSLDGKMEFNQELDRGFLIDDVPFMNALNHAPFPQTTFPKGFPFPNIDSSHAFCHLYPLEGYRPQTIYWDPQLAAVFQVSSNIPADPPSKKSFPVVIVATVVPIVVLLVIVFIIAYLLSPTLQNIITPFKHKQSAAQAEAVKGRWKQTVKK